MKTHVPAKDTYVCDRCGEQETILSLKDGCQPTEWASIVVFQIGQNEAKWDACPTCVEGFVAWIESAIPADTGAAAGSAAADEPRAQGDSLTPEQTGCSTAPRSSGSNKGRGASGLEEI